MSKKTAVSNRTGELNELLIEELGRQHQYVQKLKKSGERGFALIAADAFVRGMRDSGYKTTARAIDEFIDNSIQAQASRVDVIYTTGISNGKQIISNVAVIDDGHGMEPDMIRAAVLWGGTHREDDRSGFGRYGFGLPSAAVSQSKRFEVYSRIERGQWHRVGVDLDDICSGRLTNENGVVLAPNAEIAELPNFVKEYLGDHSLEHGTVILLVSPDRQTSGFRNPTAFHKNMMEHLGLIYRGVLRRCTIYVNSKMVEAVDPLFLDTGARFYDLGNGIKAEALEPLLIEVKNTRGEIGYVRIRLSYMPYGFQRGPEQSQNGALKENERMKIMKENLAYFVITRAGRQIDLINKAQFAQEKFNFSMQTYDRNWAIEIDFDPVLDEEFGITVNKQQITIHERMWQILEAHGVHLMVRSLSRRYTKESHDKSDEAKRDKELKKTSESVMAEGDKFEPKLSEILPAEKEKKAKEKIHEDAKKKSKLTGRPEKEIVEEINTAIKENPYKIEFEALEGAPFYRPELYGAQTRISINTRHRFYTDLYASADPRIKSTLELLLFVLGSCEVKSSDDREIFYRKERGQWSDKLETRLELLDRRDPVQDAAAAKQVELEFSSV